MWILKFLPDFIFHLILLAGIGGMIASFVLGFIPFVSKYKLPLQIGAGILILFGAYMEGAISNEAAWLARVAELELRIAKAEAQSAEANGLLAGKLAAKDRAIAEAQAELKNRIRAGAGAMDAVCKIPSDAIEILNDAAGKGAKK